MKKNTYILPTFSSFNKINQVFYHQNVFFKYKYKDKINVKDKIVKLSNTINVFFFKNIHKNSI